MFIVTLLALLSSVAPSDQAVVTFVSYIFRSTGSVLGLCIASAVYQQVLEKDLWVRFGQLKNAREVIHGIRDSLDYVDTLPRQMRMIVERSYMLSLRASFSTTVAFACLALVCGLLVGELKLDSTIEYDKPDDTGCGSLDRDDAERVA